MQAITIKNINGVAELSLSLDAPGVYIARGRNGAGKSSAISALRSAAGDDTAIAAVTDGYKKGTVEQYGRVILSVGSRRRLDEGPDIRLLSSSPIARLIDPGIKDPERAAKARIAALLELVPLPATNDDVVTLCGDDDELMAHVGASRVDILTESEAIKNKAQELALAAEKAAQFEEGQVNAFTSQIMEIGPTKLTLWDLATARTKLDAQIRMTDRIRVEVDQRKKREAQIEEIRGTIGTRPDVEPTRASLAALNSEGEELLDKIAVLKSSLGLVDERIRFTQCALASLEARAATWDSQNAILNAPIVAATEQQLMLAEAELDEVRRQAMVAERSEQVAALNRSADKCSQEQKYHLERFAQFRDVIAEMPNRLRRIIEKQSIGGITIQDGRLAWEIDGKLHDFADRLSFGQRVKVALSIALGSAASRGVSRPVIALDPEFWTSLDPDARREMAAEASLLGVFIITEEPTDGDLRFERAE